MIKNIILAGLVMLFFTALPGLAGGEEPDVLDYNVRLDIRENGSLALVERIRFENNTGSLAQIKRIFPAQKKAFFSKARPRELSVTNGAGEPLEFMEEWNGQEDRVAIPLEKGSGSLIISYNLEDIAKTINKRSVMDIAWLGIFEKAEIKQTKLEVFLPKPVIEGELKATCRSGSGELGNCVSTRFNYAGNNRVSGVVFIDDKLKDGDRILFSLELPDHIFGSGGFIKKTAQLIKNHWIYPMLLLIAAIVVRRIFIKKKHNR